MISVAGINCKNLSCNKRGVHIWGDEGTPTKCLSFENIGVRPSPQPTALGHFYTSYDNISDLKLKFNDQLVKLRRKEF